MATKNESLIYPSDPIYKAEIDAAVNAGAAIPIQGGSQVQFLQDYSTPKLDAFRGIQSLPIGQSLDAVRGGGAGDILSSPDTFKQFFNQMGFGSSALDQNFSDLTTLRQESERRKAEQRGMISREFDVARGRIEELGEKGVGGVVARGAIRGGAGLSGLGASSVVAENIALVRREVAKEITNLEAQKQKALLSADMAEADRLDEQIGKFEKQQDKLFQRQLDLINLGLVFKREGRAEEESKISRARDIFGIVKDIPEGQTFTVGGMTFTGIKREKIEPFFTSSNIVSLMQNLQEGQTLEIPDPNTGEIWTIAGLKPKDINTLVQESTNASGEVFYTTIDKNTGQILNQVSAGKIGKGRAGPSPGDFGAGKTFDAAFRQGVTDLYSGKLNRDGDPQGARERLLERLNSQFPHIGKETIADLVYFSIPDGYENQISDKGQIGATEEENIDFYTNAILGGESEYFNTDKEGKITGVNWSAIPQGVRPLVEQQLQEQGFYEQGEQGGFLQSVGGFFSNLFE